MSREEERVLLDSTSGEAHAHARILAAFDFDLHHNHPRLQKQIDELKSTLNRLILEVNSIRDLLEASPVRVRVIETRETSVREAKQLILGFMETHDIAYPDDIADELGLELKVAVEAVGELMKEGKIKESAKK